MIGEYYDNSDKPTRATDGLIVHVPFDSEKYRYCKECSTLKTKDEFKIDRHQSHMLQEEIRSTICGECKDFWSYRGEQIRLGNPEFLKVDDDPYDN